MGRHRTILALVAVALVAAACGTRDARDEGPAANAPARSSAPAVETGPTEGTPIAPDASGVAASPDPAAEGQSAAPANSGRKSTAAPKAPASGGAPPSRSGGSTNNRSSSGSAGPKGPSQAASVAPAPSPNAVPTTPGAPTPGGTKSPVIVASVGCLSGPAGVTLLPIFQGAQVWVKYINTKGGLNGHPVNLLVYDDGCDPARHRAQVQEAVERRKAIAFLDNQEPFTGQASVQYVESKRIPVVGMSLGETWNYTSPMYFPQASAGKAVIYTGIAAAAQQLLPKGKKKLASLVCAEAQLCRDSDKLFADAAKELGFEHVSRATSSLAQPDFTAECLNARNAGAEVMIMLMDSNSITRISSACARQGYKPTYATVSSLVTERQTENPNLVGMVASSPNFPWFQTGTPATDEYQHAMKTVGSAVPQGLGPSTGWTAGKLLERAGANMPEPPTSEAILRGLWSLKNDDLGGLTYPLTFTENQPAKPISCWFNLAIENGKWVSPDRKMQCRPAPPGTT